MPEDDFLADVADGRREQHRAADEARERAHRREQAEQALVSSWEQTLRDTGQGCVRALHGRPTVPLIEQHNNRLRYAGVNGWHLAAPKYRLSLAVDEQGHFWPAMNGATRRELHLLEGWVRVSMWGPQGFIGRYGTGRGDNGTPGAWRSIRVDGWLRMPRGDAFLVDPRVTVPRADASQAGDGIVFAHDGVRWRYPGDNGGDYATSDIPFRAAVVTAAALTTPAGEGRPTT